MLLCGWLGFQFVLRVGLVVRVVGGYFWVLYLITVWFGLDLVLVLGAAPGLLVVIVAFVLF